MSEVLQKLRTHASRLAVSRSAGGAVLSLGLKVVGSALNVVMLTLIARSMSVDAFGRFALWFNVISFLAVVAGCGQEKLIVRSWNEYVSSRHYERARGALRFGAQVSLAATAALVPLVIAAGWWLQAPAALIAGACTLLVLQTSYTFMCHATRAIVGIAGGDGHEITWRLVVIAGAAGALLARVPIDEAGIFALAGLGMGAAMLLQLRAVRIELPDPVRHATSRMDVAAWSERSSKMWAGGVLEAANQFLEVVLVGIVLSPAAAGGYFVVVRLANAFAMITSGLNSYSTREIARLHYSEGASAMGGTLRTLGVITTVLVGVGAAVVVGAGDTILSVFGPAYVTQYPLLIILSFGTAFVALTGPAPAILLLTGHEGVYSLIIGFSVAARCIALLALTPSFGALGAVLASSGTSILTALVLNLACRRLAAMNPAVTLLFPGPPRASS